MFQYGRHSFTLVPCPFSFSSSNGKSCCLMYFASILLCLHKYFWPNGKLSPQLQRILKLFTFKMEKFDLNLCGDSVNCINCVTDHPKVGSFECHWYRVHRKLNSVFSCLDNAQLTPHTVQCIHHIE